MTFEDQELLFQQEWTGKGERGLRDYLLIPAMFFGAISPGLYISSLIVNYIHGYWIALLMNVIGYGLTHLFFLGRIDRSLRSILNLKSSWISRGFLFNILFNIFGFLYAISESTLIPGLSNSSVKTFLKISSCISAILFAGYPGFLLSAIKAIPFWKSLFEPLIFFLQGLMGGVSLQIITMFSILKDSSLSNVLIKLNFVLTGLVFFLMVMTLIMKRSHEGAEKISVEFLIKGEFSTIFIGGVVIMGLVIPLIIIATGILLSLDFSEYRFLYYFAMVMELIGIYLSKYSILNAGVYVPFDYQKEEI